MKKIEAKTLEDAYAVATKEFGCSITELDCEIVRYPSSGFLGLCSKQAVIVVAKKHINNTPDRDSDMPISPNDTKFEKKDETRIETIEKAIDRSKSNESEVFMYDKESVGKDSIVSAFFDHDCNDEFVSTSTQNNIPLQEEIEEQLTSLLGNICFKIDTIEVDVIGDTAYVFIDGEDAALLIGKKGYRYNAFLYMISIWLQNVYGLYLKLEIAQFIASQQEMIRSRMEPVIEYVKEHGYGKTRALDGVLVHIALDQLREEFPDKYIIIKRAHNGDRYVVISESTKK